MIYEDVVNYSADEIVVLINSAYRPSGSNAGGWTHEGAVLDGPRIDGEALLAELATGRFLAVRPSATEPIIGCVHITVDHDGGWYLSLLAVDPVRQAGGLGRKILDEVARQAVTAKVPHLRISVINRREDLIAWYERRGFSRTGATAAFPYEDPTVGRPLTDDLTLIILEKRLLSKAGNIL